MYKDNEKCPICGIGTLKKKIIDETFKYKNQAITIPDYTIYECSECDEAIVDNETLKKTAKEIRAFYKHVINDVL